MPSWKSTKSGNHFRPKRRVGISSGRNNNSSSGTQSSPIHPPTHKPPRELDTGIWAGKHINQKKYQRALDTIRQGRDNINKNTYHSSDEAELLSCTLNFNNALQTHARTGITQREAIKLGKLVDRCIR